MPQLVPIKLAAVSNCAIVPELAPVLPVNGAVPDLLVSLRFVQEDALIQFVVPFATVVPPFADASYAPRYSFWDLTPALSLR